MLGGATSEPILVTCLCDIADQRTALTDGGLAGRAQQVGSLELAPAPLMGRDAQRHEPLRGGLAISQASHGPASKHYGARRLGRSVQGWSAGHPPPTTPPATERGASED